MKDVERIALDTAKGMADVHDFGELIVNFRDLSVAQLVRQRVQGGDLEGGLDLVDGLAVLGLRDAKAVPCECAIPILICRPCDVCMWLGLVCHITNM